VEDIPSIAASGLLEKCANVRIKQVHLAKVSFPTIHTFKTHAIGTLFIV